MRGTRTTIAGIVCHQVNHGPAPGAAQAVGRHKKSPADEAREASLESQKEVLTDKNHKIYFKECQ